jgi:hypothetical protein
MSKRKLYGKLKEKFGEGKYPDMPAPEDRSTRLEMGELELTEDPAAIIPPPELPSDEQLPPPSDAVSRAGRGASRVPMEATVEVGLPRPAPQEPAAMLAKPGFNELQDEESDSSDEDFAKPGLLDVLKERFEGGVNQLGPRSDATGTGKALSTARPPAAMRSRFDAARLPEQEGVGIGDRPGKSLMAEDEPGIGLEMTPDRHQTLIDPPETTEQMPEQAQVPNRQLAAAVNATSAVASNSDAQNAMQRERAPENNSAYWAALKGIANASGRNAHGTAYYDAKMAEEQQAQKNWQARLAQELTSKYRTDQMKEKQREFDVKTEENRLKAEELKNYREAQVEMQKQRLASGDEHAEAIQRRFNETKIQKVVSEMPQPRTVDAFKRIRKRLEDPTEIQGWDTAKTFDKAGRVSGVLSPTGIPFQIFANEWRKGTEAEGMMQDVMAISLDTSGKVLNEQEMANVEKRLGLAAGQSQAAFRNALRNELEAAEQRVDLYIRSQSPEVQAELDKRGVRPNFKPSETTGYAPRQHFSLPDGERIKKEVPILGNGAVGKGVRATADLLSGKPRAPEPPQEPAMPEARPLSGAPDAFNLGNKLGSWLRQSFGIKESVDMAKAQEDEETRKRLRGD